MSLATHIAGRIHVGTSDLDVIKIVLRKMLKSARTYKHKKERREVYKDVLEAHHRNQQVFKRYRF